jgi:hypothetical protein
MGKRRRITMPSSMNRRVSPEDRECLYRMFLCEYNRNIQDMENRKKIEQEAAAKENLANGGKCCGTCELWNHDRDYIIAERKRVKKCSSVPLSSEIWGPPVEISSREFSSPGIGICQRNPTLRHGEYYMPYCAFCNGSGVVDNAQGLGFHSCPRCGGSGTGPTKAHHGIDCPYWEQKE